MCGTISRLAACCHRRASQPCVMSPACSAVVVCVLPDVLCVVLWHGWTVTCRVSCADVRRHVMCCGAGVWQDVVCRGTGGWRYLVCHGVVGGKMLCVVARWQRDVVCRGAGGQQDVMCHVCGMVSGGEMGCTPWYMSGHSGQRHVL